MIGDNSCGVHSVVAGKTVENVEALEILTYGRLRPRVSGTGEEELNQIIAESGPRGEICHRLRGLQDTYGELIGQRFPNIARRVSGYNLDQLLPENGFNVAGTLVASEGTCVTVLEARVRLVDRYPGRALLVLGYADVYTAADHVPEILEFKPVGLEGFEHRLVDFMQAKELHPEDLGLLPEGRDWLLVEFGADTVEEARDRAHEAIATLTRKPDAPHMALYDDERKEQRIWEIREAGLDATAHPPDRDVMWPGWEDSAVRPDTLGKYLRDLQGLLDPYNYHAAFYGHFG